MPTIQPPYYPIIYVRGFAMTSSEIEATTTTPYMGFNLGATKIRQIHNGKVIRHFFESPLIRLMKEYGYQDAYLNGNLLTRNLSAKAIFIHRYYDEADRDFGSGNRPSIIGTAQSLRQLIADIRQTICGEDRQLQQGCRRNERRPGTYRKRLCKKSAAGPYPSIA